MYSTDRPPSFVQAIVHPSAARGVALVLAGVFLLASTSKMVNPLPLAMLLSWLQGIDASSGLVQLEVAMVVTWEMALALLLSCCWASRFSLLATGITLIVFTVVLIRLSAWKDAPSCGCFGFLHCEYVGGSLLPPDVLRNMMLLFAIGFVATARRRLPK